MAKIILSSPHSHNLTQTNTLMLRVALACLPGFAALTYFFGPGILLNLLLTLTSCLLAEAWVLKLRKRSLSVLKDNSALVTGVLLAACLPASAPWWIPVLGSLFAILLTKQLYGGLGQNPLNPAMAAYAFLLISFPVPMTQWPLASLAAEAGWLNSLTSADALTSATPLDAFRNKGQLMAEEFWASEQLHSSQLTASTYIALAWLVGGLYLTATRIINWQVPLAFFAGLAVFGLFLWGLSPSLYTPVWLHFTAGSAVFAGFFILTDPVSGATSLKGRILFAVGAAILVISIRTWGNYPDGIAFSVLLMNFAAPTLDYFTRPRVYGHSK